MTLKMQSVVEASSCYGSIGIVLYAATRVSETRMSS